MGESTSTGADTEVDAPDQSVVHSGESKGEGNKAPGDDWIKKSQFIAALNNATATTDRLTQQNADLQRQLNELRQAKADTGTKEVTRGELKRLVEGGDITQDQADALWDKQQEAKVKREAAAAATATVSERERASYVEATLSGYRSHVGAAWVEGTPERAKVAKEFQALLALGYPSTKETEAAALRAAFGDLETLSASQSARPGSSETHTETGGGRPDRGGKSDVIKDLSAKQKEHYTRLIGQGIYKDWQEVRSELEGAPKRGKAR